MIPDKNLFLVTSSIKPAIGVFNHQERFEQTILGLKSIREKVPEALIILCDVSLAPLTDEENNTLQQNCNMLFNLSQEPLVRELSEKGMKGQAENVLIYNVLAAMKGDPNLMKILSDVKRIFKISARSLLEDGFDISKYDNLFGKYVFKKRIPTWMTINTETNKYGTNFMDLGATYLLITRFFSFCPSLIDNYLQVIQKNLSLLQFIDTEHAHYVNIPKQHLVEFDKVYCRGWLAGNGTVESY